MVQGLKPPPLPARRRRLLVEGLLCWFALLAVAVAADIHSGYVLLATLPAGLLGLFLFLLHWLLPGISSVNSPLRRVRRAAAPALFGMLAFGSCRMALSRGAPENQFRAVTGLSVPTGVSNLCTKLLFGPVGGSGTVYFESNPAIVSNMIATRRLERDWDFSGADAQAYLERAVPAQLPRPAHTNWVSYQTPSDSSRNRHLSIFWSTNGPGVYAFTGY